MSTTEKKLIKVNLKDLVFKGEQQIEDLVRYLTEALPRIDLTRKGNELELMIPISLSKRAIKLRLKKFLHKSNLKEDLRPISSNEGYVIEERKRYELTYY